VTQYLHLIFLIIHYGRLKHSGYSFNDTRDSGLSKFDFIVNKSQKAARFSSVKSLFWKNAFLRRILCEVSFFRQGFSTRLGHLNAPQKNLCYIRIPKSASTSLSFAMLSFRYSELKLKHVSDVDVNYLAEIHLENKIAPEQSSSIFFTAVRNPYARIVSVYRSFFEKKNENFIYEDYLFGILGRNLSFSEFVRRVEIIPDRLKDAHLKPQHLFIDAYDQKITNVVVLKLEKPDQVDHFLSGFNISMEHLNRSESGYNYRDYYDSETTKIVARIYKKDLERFDYSF
jgi:hypothetical protein